MKKNILVKVILAFVLILSLLTPLSTATTEAASKTYTMFVNITSGHLNVRKAPSTTSKELDSNELTKGKKIQVYANVTVKKGWKMVKYKNKKAYVKAEFLRYSYLMDKTKVYTYKEDYYGTVKHVYDGVHTDGWDIWKVDNDSYRVYEDKNGLYSGVMGGENYSTIKYPIKIGQSWDMGSNGSSHTARITSVTKTIKTPADTFKNCIEVTDEFGTKSYYAKNIGIVKCVFSNGKIQTELIGLKKK